MINEVAGLVGIAMGVPDGEALGEEVGSAVGVGVAALSSESIIV